MNSCQRLSLCDVPGIWCRYVGHCNCATDIKEVTFLGSKDELVACSSDDGYVFIYDSVRACMVPPLCPRSCVNAAPYLSVSSAAASFAHCGPCSSKEPTVSTAQIWLQCPSAAACVLGCKCAAGRHHAHAAAEGH